MAEQEAKKISKLDRSVELFKLLMRTRRGRTAIFALGGIIAFVMVMVVYLIISSLPEKIIIPEEVIGANDKSPRVILLTPELRLKQLAESALLNPPVPEGEDGEEDKDVTADTEKDDEGEPHYNDDDGRKIHAYPVSFNKESSIVSVSFAEPYKDVTVSRPVLGTDVSFFDGKANFEESEIDINLDQVLKLVEPEVPVFKYMGVPLRVPSYLRMEENKIDPNVAPVELNEIEIGLLARDDGFIVPSVSRDGRKPWSYYARPFDGDVNAPKVAIIITDLGMDDIATEVAVKRLPFEVTLSFNPYADDLKAKMAYARENGHEVMLDLPIEKVDSGIIDSGPYAITSSRTFEKNKRLINEILSLTEGCVGLIGIGNLIGGDEDKMKEILKLIRNFGLLYIADSYGNTSEVVNSIPGLPHAIMTVNLDGKHFRTSVEARLEYLTKQALADGVAVGVGSWSPLTMNAIFEWLPKFKENGIVLAPVSYVVNE